MITIDIIFDIILYAHVFKSIITLRMIRDASSYLSMQ